MDMGVDTFKVTPPPKTFVLTERFQTDFGERIPTGNTVYFDGSHPAKMHNYYAFLYNKITFEAVEKYKGKHEAIVFARAATAGGQRFPVHWGGDPLSTFEAMAETLRGGLSLGVSGFGYWAHDIGGFMHDLGMLLYDALLYADVKQVVEVFMEALIPHCINGGSRLERYQVIRGYMGVAVIGCVE